MPSTAPIPEAYQYMVQGFDACLAQCNAHNNPVWLYFVNYILCTGDVDSLKGKEKGNARPN